MQQRTKLRRIREDELDATQEDVIRKVAGLSLSTYVRAEGGSGGVTFATAKKILQAFNALAKDKGKAQYRIDDLGL